MSSFTRFLGAEAKRGSLVENLAGLRQGGMTKDMAWSELLEEKARKHPDRTMLRYKEERLTYMEMDDNANRTANFLLKLGARQKMGIGIFMRNSPRFLDLFFAAQKLGMYVVPINCELRGDGLQYVINHSDVQLIACDAELLDPILAVRDQLENIRNIIVNDIEEEAREFAIPPDVDLLSRAWHPMASCRNPKVGYAAGSDMCMIMYTSGTTGRPKGVVYTVNASRVKILTVMAGVLLKKKDVYYTAFSLAHGNAMLLTVTLSMSMGTTIALARKFSASRFWDDIRKYDVTVFNTIGSIIPILMKQPEKPSDRDNRVRFVFSAACPADMWKAFEKRFGVTIYEGYGAVDSGGKGIMNFATAPVGSLGKPSKGLGVFRVVDDQGRDCPPGEPGELIFEAKGKGQGIPYYKNEKATNEKVRDGWMYTGDKVRLDKRGYVYFVGRNTESMRKGGENVSAYEVEHVIMKHPAVEDVAVYAVPSDLAEDEIMASVKLVKEADFSPEHLRTFLSDKIAKFAIPRYVRVVDEFPMTNSHRVIKGVLEQEGVTPDTFDALNPL
ncbi:MAG: AMP-binding protein [Desulfatibacillum sp.]|nr:AMP-binding protein [Desulfatibacillum sp.]